MSGWYCAVGKSWMTSPGVVRNSSYVEPCSTRHITVCKSRNDTLLALAFVLGSNLPGVNVSKPSVTKPQP